MGGNCIVACAVAFSAQLEISFCNWKIYLTSLCESSYKPVYANPALIRTFVAAPLKISLFQSEIVRIKLYFVYHVSIYVASYKRNRIVSWWRGFCSNIGSLRPCRYENYEGSLHNAFTGTTERDCKQKNRYYNGRTAVMTRWRGRNNTDAWTRLGFYTNFCWQECRYSQGFCHENSYKSRVRINKLMRKFV